MVEEKWIPRNRVKQLAKKLRSEGKTIATLNGSFDLLHAGHLHILFEAKKSADVLIVALNSDASIKQYKSEERPIIDLENRLKMMAALSCVDYVTSFEETDPRAILKEIDPDVHNNGSEYGENCIEASCVRKLNIIPLIDGLSTSQIIKKIRSTETSKVPN